MSQEKMTNASLDSNIFASESPSPSQQSTPSLAPSLTPAQQPVHEYVEGNLLAGTVEIEISYRESVTGSYASFDETWNYIRTNGNLVTPNLTETHDLGKWQRQLADGTYVQDWEPTGSFYDTFQLYVCNDYIDCGDYYELQVVLERPARISEHVDMGESTRIVINELTGESVMITRIEEPYGSSFWGNEMYVYDYDCYISAYEDSSNMMDPYGSDDPYWIPCYAGTLRISKEVNIGVIVLRTYGDITEIGLDFANYLQFNDEGILVTALYNGD